MSDGQEIFSIVEVVCWAENGDEPIMLKAVVSAGPGDPVELSAQEARELGQLLIRLADEIPE